MGRVTARDVSGRGSTLEQLWKTRLNTLAVPAAIGSFSSPLFAGVRLIVARRRNTLRRCRDDPDYRVLGELWAPSMLLLFGDPRRRLTLPALATAALWGANALYRVDVI